MPLIDVVIKFGGSAITDKSQLETLLVHKLEKACQHVKKCMDAGLTCVVVHGAGSFGHHQAKQFAVNSGLVGVTSEEETKLKMWGFCVTRQSVTKLNKSVVDALLDVGVFAVSCSPGPSWQTDKRQPTSWPREHITALLEHGCVPVLHGDCTLDDTLGCCILSGDTIIQTLCSTFTVKRVVFLADVPGVFNKPPSEPDATLLHHINVDLDGTVSNDVVMTTSSHDVTGGIRLKLQTAINIVLQTQGRCTVVICSVDSTQVFSICSEEKIDGSIDYTLVALKESPVKNA